MPNQWTGPRPFADRFWEKVEKSDGCWEWIAGKHGNGYGALRRAHGQGNVLAHRASWELHYGPIPEDLCVCHKCDNPPCVRPDHLFLGTLEDNWADMRQKGRGSKPPVLRGDAHPSRRYPERLRRGAANNKAKLTEADVIAIRAMHAEGASIRALAQQYGLNKRTIGQVVHRKTWRHVA